MTIVCAHCPACGGLDLFTQQVPDPDGEIGDYAVLRCWRKECPDPDAANRLLSNCEIHHVVKVDDDGRWTVKHPLRERVDDKLFDCRIYGIPVARIVADRMRDLPLEAGLHRLIDESGIFDPADLDNPEYAGGPWGWERL